MEMMMMIDRRPCVSRTWQEILWLMIGVQLHRLTVENTYIKYSMQPKLREVNIHLCCSGWSRAEGSRECKIPICAIGCDNGGECTAPDKCKCAPGFEGKYCQNDINECNASPCSCPSGDQKCSAVCTNTYGSYKCSCGQGYRLYADGACRDNNECEIQNGGCSQRCHNFEGGYVCSCNDSFYLTDDRRTCKAIPTYTEYSRLCVNSMNNFVVKSCWPSTLKILSAFYGRIEDSHCQSKGRPFKPCSVNGITKFLRDLCSGKSTCFIKASNETLAILGDPCPDVDKYVEITTTCAAKQSTRS